MMTNISRDFFINRITFRIPSASVCNHKAKIKERVIEIECPLNDEEDEHNEIKKESTEVVKIGFAQTSSLTIVLFKNKYQF